MKSKNTSVFSSEFSIVDLVQNRFRTFSMRAWIGHLFKYYVQDIDIDNMAFSCTKQASEAVCYQYSVVGSELATSSRYYLYLQIYGRDPQLARPNSFYTSNSTGQYWYRQWYSCTVGQQDTSYFQVVGYYYSCRHATDRYGLKYQLLVVLSYWYSMIVSEYYMQQLGLVPYYHSSTCFTYRTIFFIHA